MIKALFADALNAPRHTNMLGRYGCWLLLIGFSLLSTACGLRSPIPPSTGHITAPTPVIPSITAPPPVVDRTFELPETSQTEQTETYSVVVNNVDVNQLLFALARDAKINIDVHTGINGFVTLNAINQTLPQLLQRISNQVAIRWQLNNNFLTIEPDSPFTKHYTIDYVNIARNVDGAISASTSIQSTSNSGGLDGSGNTSSTRVTNTSENHFWGNIENHVRAILQQNDASSTKNSVIANRESGVLTVWATGNQHKRIANFLDQVLRSVQRQVMIEATIVEVQLSSGYEQGINWSRFRSNGDGFSFSPANVASSTETSIQPFVLQYQRDKNSTGLDLSGALRFLENYGDVRVLSSPRLAVLNNQPAVMKVVENYVYFNVRSETTTTSNVGTNVSVSTTPQSVSVGLVLTVTPQIAGNDQVTLNVRPSISSISALKEDPNPSIPEGVKNLVPQIRTREIESVMRVSSGDIAVLGGLMEDSASLYNARVPGLGAVPIAGELLSQRNNTRRKSELIIFIRPLVLHENSVQGDLSSYTPYLAEDNFFQNSDPIFQPFALPTNIIP